MEGKTGFMRLWQMRMNEKLLGYLGGEQPEKALAVYERRITAGFARWGKSGGLLTTVSILLPAGECGTHSGWR